ncbi:hypothetical protein J416_02706 [Gracilibacillus halophilus YIM-C55.5]|uniref:Threonylcarbamoyl-AMP synthase n=1 Tax=Gracilibacillus halophilus YIM-C55.5 TaxID=1308866 RepID=N4WFD8_9BACI|nr:L-threonylcarbamoyladenylate synthase [Gracilibacillus halophilus]ENH97984.1 hypothetical protein J416_02706 [Gracilibacillus halophilus YIM-C55.5]
MRTRRWNFAEETIDEAAQLIRQGEVIAFPTETVYGLGADATNEQAVRKIFQAKGRPADNPLIIHVHDNKQIARYVTDIPRVAQQMMDAFMPGPLTVILKSNGTVAPTVTAGMDTVAIRVPDHAVARQFIEATQLPLAAPSANLSGKPSPTTAEHVDQDLNTRIAGIIDGGATGVGVESTVVDCTSDVPIILRPGGITKDMLQDVVGQVTYDDAIQTDDQPKAPGMKYQHYQPDAPLRLIDGDQAFFQQQIDALEKQGKTVGVIASEPLASQLRTNYLYRCGQRNDLSTVAAKLYYALRYFNQMEMDIILSETYPFEGIGQAIMNRLTKAATDKLEANRHT